MVDTSAFVSLGIADCHELLLAEFDVATTERILTELEAMAKHEATAEHDDPHGRAPTAVLDRRSAIAVHHVDEPVPETSRIDAGEASCVRLARTLDADFLLTDDRRALFELQRLVAAEVPISPIVLRALVARGVLGRADARERLETIAETRSWLGAPISRRARGLFDE